MPVDGTFDLVKGMCKRIRFVIDYPDTNGAVQFKAVNTDFSVGKYIHWCDFGFYQVCLFITVYIRYVSLLQ